MLRSEKFGFQKNTAFASICLDPKMLIVTGRVCPDQGAAA